MSKESFKNRASLELTLPVARTVRLQPHRLKARSLALIESIVALIACSVPIALAQEVNAPPIKQAPAYPDHERLMVVRDGQGRERPITSLADWNVRRDHILAHFQEVAGKLPGGERRVPLDFQVISD